jgi:hypothetical protein
MGLLGSLVTKGAKLGVNAAAAPASGSVAGEVGNAAGGGPAASVAGAVADVGIDGAVGALSKTGTLGRGLGVGYLGHTAFGAGKSLGDRIAGTKTDATVDAENQNQLHNQTWQRNLYDNVIADPGGGLDRLQTETRGAIGDAYGAYQDKQKTQQMETNRRMSRPMSEGYKSNVNNLQGLMSRR